MSYFTLTCLALVSSVLSVLVGIDFERWRQGRRHRRETERWRELLRERPW